MFNKAGVFSGSGPSSNVSATTGLWVATAVRTPRQFCDALVNGLASISEPRLKVRVTALVGLIFIG
jgi:hypothetical protein